MQNCPFFLHKSCKKSNRCEKTLKFCLILSSFSIVGQGGKKKYRDQNLCQLSPYLSFLAFPGMKLERNADGLPRVASDDADLVLAPNPEEPDTTQNKNHRQIKFLDGEREKVSFRLNDLSISYIL